MHPRESWKMISLNMHFKVKIFLKNDLFQIKEDVHPSGRSYVTMTGDKAWEFHKWLSWWQEPGDPDPLVKDLWTIHCMILGMTLRTNVICVLLDFKLLFLLLFWMCHNRSWSLILHISITVLEIMVLICLEQGLQHLSV